MLDCTDEVIAKCKYCDGNVLIAQVGNEYTKNCGFNSGCKNCRIYRKDRVLKFHKLGWLKIQVINFWNGSIIEDGE